jgi:hypothetical protein
MSNYEDGDNMNTTIDNNEHDYWHAESAIDRIDNTLQLQMLQLQIENKLRIAAQRKREAVDRELIVNLKANTERLREF